MGVQVTIKGEPPQEPVIFISNHRSYFDPVVVLAYTKALPVAKAEVSRWPLLGTAIRVSGVMFVQRESQVSRRRTLAGLTDAVKTGCSVLIFPEGTTSDAAGSLSFRKGTFQAAARENLAIVPVALDYADKADYWIGDDTFLPHYAKTFAKPKVRVWIHFGLKMAGHDTGTLLEESKKWIDTELGEIRNLIGAENA
jgi:1-acyl-sn-glycerol-3-phosphate acyltransferase